MTSRSVTVSAGKVRGSVDAVLLTTGGGIVGKVIEPDGTGVAGVEVKSAASVSNAGLRGLRKLRDAAGPRFKAGWSADEPAIITSRTKIYRAPPLPRDVFRTNSYAKF